MKKMLAQLVTTVAIASSVLFAFQVPANAFAAVCSESHLSLRPGAHHLLIF
jgi:hypothetical protein